VRECDVRPKHHPAPLSMPPVGRGSLSKALEYPRGRRLLPLREKVLEEASAGDVI
jgi:hypothetical protein